MKDNYVKFVIKKIQNIINVKRVKKKLCVNVLKFISIKLISIIKYWKEIMSILSLLKSVLFTI